MFVDYSLDAIQFVPAETTAVLQSDE